jgi:two-component system LytT family response regulator
LSAVIRTLLIDDEILGRLALRQALATHEEVTIVGECGSADEALQAIDALTPDLLFLDIQMPGMDGFKLLRGLSDDPLPMVVFATAYNQHALRAFDAGAVDYVLKPIDQARFDQAMARVREKWRSLDERQGRRAASAGQNPYVQRISVRTGDRIRVIQTGDIDWFRSNGNYLELHVGGASLLYRESLRNLLASLDPAQFLRIHRGIVVNVGRIREIHPLFKDNAEVVLDDGTRLSLSRRFRRGANRALGGR